MTRRLFASAAALCLVAGLPAPAASAPADEDARAWLLRIHRAPQELDYEGTFVYRQGGQLETMRIVHRADDGRVRERLIALTGPPREVIRTDDEVRCYLPDQQSVFIEQRRPDRKAFLSIVPERLPEVEQNYAMQLGDVGRIAGRSAQQLLIRARDDYRYGYRLWADRETGLLLKADLMSDRGRVLEQFMFTQIRLGGPIPDEALEPRTPMTGLIRYDDTRVAGEGPSRSWRAAQPPKGFRLTGVVVRRLPKADRVVQQLVYSDSLAAVSVFIEELDGGVAQEMVEGPMRMGALYALGRFLDGHHVTVVGEVPAKTIAAIGNSLVPAPAE
jgi:sigma-E factor negative regulatory protein RseB